MRGPLRNVWRIGLEMLEEAYTPGANDTAKSRAWKFVCMISRMLFWLPTGSKWVPKEVLLSRLERLKEGHWLDLVRQARSNQEPPDVEAW